MRNHTPLRNLLPPMVTPPAVHTRVRTRTRTHTHASLAFSLSGWSFSSSCGRLLPAPAPGHPAQCRDRAVTALPPCTPLLYKHASQPPTCEPFLLPLPGGKQAYISPVRCRGPQRDLGSDYRVWAASFHSLTEEASTGPGPCED